MPPPAGTFRVLTVGESHACGVHTDGDVECWGDPGMKAPTGLNIDRL
jgi:hypothetical protein